MSKNNEKQYLPALFLTIHQLFVLESDVCDENEGEDS